MPLFPFSSVYFIFKRSWTWFTITNTKPILLSRFLWIWLKDICLQLGASAPQFYKALIENINQLKDGSLKQQGIFYYHNSDLQVKRCFPRKRQEQSKRFSTQMKFVTKISSGPSCSKAD